MKNIIEKETSLTDKSGDTHLVRIFIIENEYISIRSFKGLECTGYINMYFHPNKRIYLDTVYCYDEYRSLGIATKLSEIADSILEPFEGYIIRGAYIPSQLSYDREMGHKCSKEELNRRALNYYHKNGYEILSFVDYLKNQNKYPDLTVKDDFELSEELADIIVYKKIKPKR